MQIALERDLGDIRVSIEQGSRQLERELRGDLDKVGRNTYLFPATLLLGMIIFFLTVILPLSNRVAELAVEVCALEDAIRIQLEEPATAGNAARELSPQPVNAHEGLAEGVAPQDLVIPLVPPPTH